MHTSTPEFAELITGSHRVVETVEIIYPEGDAGPVFDVASGDFQIDSSAAVRHNASFRLSSSTLTPREVKDALSAPGISARYSRGMWVPGAAEPELKRVLTGRVAVGALKLNRDTLGEVPVTLFDSFTELQWSATRGFSVQPGQNYATAIRRLIGDYAPELEWADLMSTEYETPALTYPSSSNAEYGAIATEMAQAIGAEVYFDAFDKLNLTPIPLTYGRPQGWTFDLDSDTSGVIDAELTINNDKMPNGVIIRGQHSSGSGEVVGEAWDDNPTSRTFAGRRRKPITVPTEKVLTVRQAETMARGILEKILGGAFELVLRIVPNPLLVEGALCRVTSTRYDLNQDFVVRSISGDAGRDQIGSPWTVTLRRGVVPAEIQGASS